MNDHDISNGACVKCGLFHGYIATSGVACYADTPAVVERPPPLPPPKPLILGEVIRQLAFPTPGDLERIKDSEVLPVLVEEWFDLEPVGQDWDGEFRPLGTFTKVVTPSPIADTFVLERETPEGWKFGRDQHGPIAYGPMTIPVFTTDDAPPPNTCEKMAPNPFSPPAVGVSWDSPVTPHHGGFPDLGPIRYSTAEVQILNLRGEIQALKEAKERAIREGVCDLERRETVAAYVIGEGVERRVVYGCVAALRAIREKTAGDNKS